MKKKLMSALLTLCLLLTGLTALSAEAGALAFGMDGFTPIRVYDGRFTDVKQTDWFYDSVASLYELGLTNGQTAIKFGARSSVSLAEAVSFAARIHSIYHYGSPSLGPALYTQSGGEWYQPYLLYLQDAGVVDERFDGAYRRAATRAETAWILSRVLPEDELGYINADAVYRGYQSRQYITDVSPSSPYASEILSLYAAGIVTGSDESGSFRPDSEITRAELSAMLIRMVLPESRVLLDWGSAASIPSQAEPAVTSYKDLVWETGRYVPTHAVDDEQAILSNVRWLFANGWTDIDLHLDSYATRPAVMNQLLDNYITASQLYLEQGYTAVSSQYDRLGNISLSFYNPNGGDRDAALKKAVEIHDRFHADGTVTDGMTDIETARVYAEYLCRTCEYDYASPRLSHTAYGALIDGSAVCEGYTAAYNILLKLEGINASTAQFPNHIWTTATLDGILYHIDVTWCDQGYGFEDRFFCMTPEFAMSRDPYSYYS